ncbi:MAG: NAD(P)H-hydrate dehydratase [Geobacteraceae bacterium]|nr:NAD(P)H-hydrate dehydratase [Geobacteraceae bacterium]
MRAVTAEVMQELDRTTISGYGVSGLELMERAGSHVATIVISRFGNFKERTALIVAGKGNNGGDGFVIARLLAEAGWSVSLLIFTAAYAGDAEANFRRTPPSVKQIDFKSAVQSEIEAIVQGSAVIIDAIFGTGLKSGLEGHYAGLAALINSSEKPVIAVDIPSGVDATSGRTLGGAIKADITVTFGAAKIGQLLYPGAGYVGELLVTDIGIPAVLVEKTAIIEFIDAEYAAKLVTPRSRTAHKGSYGHCLIVAGSCGKSGAAAMAANSAMRAGVGLVTLAVPCGIHPVVEVKTTEAMTVPLPESPAGAIAFDSLKVIEHLIEGKDVIAAGPGLGLDEETIAVIKGIVSTAKLPLLLDADALNAVAEDISILPGSSSPTVVLTPHPGEMARLTGASVTAIESDRIGAARHFAATNGCYLLLKGARTVIAAPDGRIAINSTGNPGMASGGMGDVLSGVITALLAQGYEPFDACCLGAYCHGLAGDMVAEEKGEIGLIATDVQEMVPYAFKKLLEVRIS